MCGYRLINDHFPQFCSDYRVFERPDPRASPDSDRSLVPGGVGPHSSGARPGLGPPGEARGRPEGAAPWGFCATHITEGRFDGHRWARVVKGAHRERESCAQSIEKCS